MKKKVFYFYIKLIFQYPKIGLLLKPVAVLFEEAMVIPVFLTEQENKSICMGDMRLLKQMNIDYQMNYFNMIQTKKNGMKYTLA